MITVVRGAISKDICDFAAKEFRLLESVIQVVEPDNNAFDHPSIGKGTFSWYAPLPFENLLEYIKPLIEEVIDGHLYSTYSYGRVYYHGSELKVHTDRPASEISVSCCLSKDADWALQFDGSSVELDVGDICIFPGSEIPHWRDCFTGELYVGAFLQYVRSYGDRANLKWDTRPTLAISPMVEE